MPKSKSKSKTKSKTGKDSKKGSKKKARADKSPRPLGEEESGTVTPSTAAPSTAETSRLPSSGGTTAGALENDSAQPTTVKEKSKSEAVYDPDTGFRGYLNKTGFKYAIIRAFVALYEDPEKPDDPLEWILNFVGQGIPTELEIEAWRTEVKEIREKIEQLHKENLELRAKLEGYEGPPVEESLAEQQLKKMIAELTQAGALGWELDTTPVDECGMRMVGEE